MGNRTGRIALKNMCIMRPQILNELSVNGSYSNSIEADKGMDICIRLSVAMTEYGSEKSILITRNFAEQELCLGYTVRDWVRKMLRLHANRDNLRYFLFGVTSKQYIIEPFIPEGIEFKHEGKKAYGLGLASHWNSAALSLNCHSAFRADTVQLQKQSLSDTAEIVEETVAVESLWSCAQVDTIGKLLLGRARKRIESGQEIIDNAQGLFPRLRISDNAVKQLKRITGAAPSFSKIVKHLSILNDTMRDWQSGVFDPQGIDCSGDSKPTLQKYDRERRLTCADGQTRTFSTHSKLKNINWRIYFFAIPEKKIVHIGYVGKHLRTIKHGT
ncbi:MAG: hypothetical protein ACR2PY_09285 [Salinispira sp.]